MPLKPLKFAFLHLMFKSAVLNRESVNKFPRGHEPSCTLLHGNVDQ